jgi:CubicO group peptidase (beta-lactamase class C family)
MRKPRESATVLGKARPEQVGLSAERLERIGAAFGEEIQQGRLPGAVVLIARNGKIAYWEAFGKRDPAQPDPMAKDDIFRIYSMTKPIVSVAVLLLAEEGRLALHEPIGKYCPPLAKLQVAHRNPGGARQGPGANPVQGQGYTLKRAVREITIQDLLRHTSGLTYAFRANHLEREYTEMERGIMDASNAEVVERLGSVPLAFEPGTTWEYSRGTDVLGRLVEVVAGQSLGEFLAERILRPLGMKDTGFWAQSKAQSRVAQPGPDPDTGKRQDVLNVTQPPRFEMGGAGLVSTAGDYIRFAQMLLNGGELAGERLLGRKTVAWMTADHLGGIDRGLDYLPGPGVGFGLGFAVRTAGGESAMPGTPGEYYWSGIAGTHFWVDPQEQLIGLLLIQAPSLRIHFRHRIRSLVLQAVVE